MTDVGFAVLYTAAHTQVGGARPNLVHSADPDDDAALGRVMNRVSDRLMAAMPAAADIR